MSAWFGSFPAHQSDTASSVYSGQADAFVLTDKQWTGEGQVIILKQWCRVTVDGAHSVRHCPCPNSYDTPRYNVDVAVVVKGDVNRFW